MQDIKKLQEEEEKLQANKEQLEKQQSYLPEKHEYLEYFNSIDIESEFIAGASKISSLRGKEAHAKKSIAGLFWQRVRDFKKGTYFLPESAKIIKVEKEISYLAQYLKEKPLRPIADELFEEVFYQSSEAAMVHYLYFLKWYLEYLRPEPENQVFLEQKIKLKEVSGYTGTDLTRLFYELYKLGIFEEKSEESFLEKVRLVFDLGEFKSNRVHTKIKKDKTNPETYIKLIKKLFNKVNNEILNPKEKKI